MSQGQGGGPPPGRSRGRSDGASRPPSGEQVPPGQPRPGRGTGTVPKTPTRPGPQPMSAPGRGGQILSGGPPGSSGQPSSAAPGSGRATRPGPGPVMAPGAPGPSRARGSGGVPASAMGAMSLGSTASSITASGTKSQVSGNFSSDFSLFKFQPVIFTFFCTSGGSGGSGSKGTDKVGLGRGSQLVARGAARPPSFILNTRPATVANSKRGDGGALFNCVTNYFK